jgi:hypothetical protein
VVAGYLLEIVDGEEREDSQSGADTMHRAGSYVEEELFHF